MVRFDLGPLHQGQIRVAKFQSSYISLIIGLRHLECQTNLRKTWAGNLMMWPDLALAP